MNPIFNHPRKHERFSLRKEVLIWDNNFDVSGNYVLTGWTESLSEGGACLIAKTDVRVQQLLRVALKAEPGQVPTLVEVRWIERVSDSDTRFGAKFIF